MAKKRLKSGVESFNTKPTRGIQRPHKIPFDFAAGFGEVQHQIIKKDYKNVIPDTDKEYRHALQNIVVRDKNPQKFSLGKWHEEFARPQHVSVCVRRKARRAALFRNGFAGRGSVKYAHWTQLSKVSCNAR